MCAFRLTASNVWRSHSNKDGDSSMNEINRKTLEYLSTKWQNPDYRFYFVGKVMRQDLVGPEPGYRESLKCPECQAVLVVMGPSLLNTFSGLCPGNDDCNGGKAWIATTVPELWDMCNVS
jgi:hypothetical protein